MGRDLTTATPVAQARIVRLRGAIVRDGSACDDIGATNGAGWRRRSLEDAGRTLRIAAAARR
jgi:hypothetical protein